MSFGTVFEAFGEDLMTPEAMAAIPDSLTPLGVAFLRCHKAAVKLLLKKTILEQEPVLTFVLALWSRNETAMAKLMKAGARIPFDDDVPKHFEAPWVTEALKRLRENFMGYHVKRAGH